MVPLALQTNKNTGPKKEMSQTVVCVGAYVAVVFVGMAIGMGIALKKTSVDAGVKKSRTDAAITGGVLGVVAAALFAYKQWDARMTPEFWAVVSILLFGLWYAVYMVFPKTLPAVPTNKSSEMQTTLIASHGAALGTALLVFAYYQLVRR